MNYTRKIQVEAYKLSIHNIEELSAWSKWNIKKDNLFENSQYLQKGELVCKMGDWIIKDNYTNKIDFYTMNNQDFINLHQTI